jgi:hypothetical protein
MERPTHGLLEFDGEKSLSRDALFIQAANLTLKLKKTELGLWLCSRTKSTNVAFPKTLSKNSQIECCPI